MSGDLSAIVNRLEAVTSRLEGLADGGGGTAGGGGGTAAASASVEEFDTAIRGSGSKLTEFFALSKKFGGEVGDQAKIVEGVFDEVRKILVSASQHSAPSKNVLGGVTKKLGEKVNQVTEYASKRRSSKSFNNLMTVSEGICCAGWVTVSPKPVPYLKEAENQALFYGNRVIKEFKGKDDDQVKWVRAYIGAIKDLQSYVKEHHTTGLVWKKDGPPAGPPAAAGPPPPPPPVIQPPSDIPASKSSDTSTDRANLLASLSKGANVTQGLRKVSDDMKTHKNPDLRASSVVKAGEVKAASKPAPKYGASTSTAKKPSVLALQGKKWVVEYQEDKSDLSISNTNPKQSVYVFKCVKSTLKISGKVNSIILDNCKRMAVCFDDVISSIEVINSQGIQVQVLGKCPTVSIEKTDGCQVFLSKNSLNCEIITAKSSEINICIPPKPGSDDFIERPVPEQFKTVWNGTCLVTECTDITS